MVCQLLVLLHALRVFVVCLGVVCRFRWFLLFSSDFAEYIGFGASGGGPRGVKLTMPFSQKAIEFFCPKTSALCGYHVWLFGEMYCFFLKSVKSELRFWVSVVIPSWLFCFFVKLTLFLKSDSLEMRPPLQGLAAAHGVAAGQFSLVFCRCVSFYCVFARFCVVCVALTNCF